VPYLPQPQPDEATKRPDRKGLKVGVVWGGNPLHGNDSRRSVPLPVFAELFDAPGVAFYSLNRDMKPGDAELLAQTSVINLAPCITDFRATAQLIMQLDLVIAVDTSTVHLAGGIAKKTWTLLPFAPDWRWLTDRSDSVWYPTMSLFRQPKPSDWASVIVEVKKALMQKASK
jgi:ADP-heptose:LPS heptosyltransferase